MATEFQREYLLRLPLPLAQLYSRAFNAKEAHARHNNSFYLFEALIKLSAAPLVAAYLLEVEQGLARVETLDRLLAQLALPSLGQWLAILRELSRYFGNRADAASHPLGHVWQHLNQPRREPALISLYRRVKNGVDGPVAADQSCSLLQVLDSIVQYRNGVFGHGADRFPEFYEKELGPLLFLAANQLLAKEMLDPFGPPGSRLVHITELRILDNNRVEVALRELTGVQGERLAPLVLSAQQAASLEPNRVALTWPGRPVPLRLDPLLLYRENELTEQVLFLNRDRNSRQVEYLSYTTGDTERDRSTAPALAALLTRITNHAVDAEQLQALAERSVAETPSVETLFGPAAPAALRLGEHELLAEIGRGGMGVVYLARQTSLGRLVALKTLPADLAGDEVALARFRREIRALARCDHPHIVKVLSNGTLPDGQLYYTMEYVPGCDLEQVWRELAAKQGRSVTTLGSSTWAQAVLTASRKRREATTSRPSLAAASGVLQTLPLAPLPDLPPVPDDPGGYARRVALLIRDAAQALQAVHDQRLIHRDIKPANLMLTPDGTRVVLMDFGLAKGQSLATSVSRAGGLLGTLRYAAPEQLAAANLKVGPAADVRALGITLWELLTRRRLFAEAADEKQLAQLVHDQDVPPLRTLDPGLERDLEAIVARATERRVADRIARAGQLADYLQLYLDGKVVPLRVPGALERALRWMRRRPAHAAAYGLLLLVLLVGAVGYGLWQAEKESRRQEVQKAEQRRLADVEQSAALEEQVGLEEIKVDRLASAEQRFRQAATRIQQEPTLAWLHTRLTGRSERLGRINRFYHWSNETEKLAAREVRLPQLSRAERKAAKTKESPLHAASNQALKEIGALDHSEWWDHLPAEDLSPRQLQNLRAAIYRQLLVTTGLRAKRGYLEFGLTDKAQPLFRSALETTRAAKRFENSFAVAQLESILCGLLKEPRPTLTSAQRRPSNAVDFYISGIVHLWFDQEADAPTRLLVSLLVPDVIDAKDPLGTAQVHLRMALLLDAQHYWTPYWLAYTLLASKKADDAELAANTCVALSPNYAPGYTARALALDLQAEKIKSAEWKAQVEQRVAADLKKATEFDPQEAADYYERRGDYLQGLDDYQRAAVAFGEAIKLAPERSDYRGERAYTYYRLDEYSKSLTDVEEALRLDESNAYAWNTRGLVYRNQGKIKEAIAQFTSALKFRPKDSYYLSNRGYTYYLDKDLDRALADLNEAIKADATNDEALQTRGLLYRKKGELKQAIADFSSAIKLQPEYSFYLSNRAYTYLAANDLDNALADATAALRWNDQNHNAFDTRGRVYQRKGEQEKAVKDFTSALTIEPQRSFYLSDRAKSHLALGDFVKALADAEKANLVDPTNEEALLVRLQVYAKTGKTAEASKLLQENVAQARASLAGGSLALAGRLALVSLRFLELKAYDDAEVLLREVVTIREMLAGDAWTTFNSKAMLGRALLGKKDYPAAETLLVAGYQGMKERENKIPPEAKAQLHEAIQSLIELYLAWDKPDDAAKWREKLTPVSTNKKSAK